jgi:hypothetical protein
MKRTRKATTQVWHNPDLAPVRSGSSASPSGGRPGERPSRSGGVAEGRGSAREPPKPAEPRRKSGIVAAPDAPDARELERRKLLSRLVTSEGPSKVTRAADEYKKAGFEYPREEDVQLTLLEHTDEVEVRAAIDTLSSLYEAAPPKRKGMLESRLRRIEELADDASTRAAAVQLRRRVIAR